MLLGTVNFENVIDNSTIKPRHNYAKLGIIKIKGVNRKSIGDSQVPIYQFTAAFNKYMKINRKNYKIFSSLLFEFTNFLEQTNKKSYTTAFVHLYRCMEYISYSFPLVYASKSHDYKGTYDSLKNFFYDKTASELKFFHVFQKELIDSGVLALKFIIDVNAPPTMKAEFNTLILRLANGKAQQVATGIEISYKDLWEFAIQIRNRYFHLLNGDGQMNINSQKIFMDYFFAAFNEHLANWIAFIYFEITRYGVEQTS